MLARCWTRRAIRRRRREPPSAPLAHPRHDKIALLTRALTPRSPRSGDAIDRLYRRFRSVACSWNFILLRRIVRSSMSCCTCTPPSPRGCPSHHTPGRRGLSDQWWTVSPLSIVVKQQSIPGPSETRDVHNRYPPCYHESAEVTARRGVGIVYPTRRVVRNVSQGFSNFLEHWTPLK